MPPKQDVKDIDEWLKLPELPVNGNTFKILKVGFVSAPLAVCERKGVAIQDTVRNHGLLPFAKVDVDDTPTLYRLNIYLTHWSCEMLEAAQMNQRSPFPRDVEFGFEGEDIYVDVK